MKLTPEQIKAFERLNRYSHTLIILSHMRADINRNNIRFFYNIFLNPIINIIQIRTFAIRINSSIFLHRLCFWHKIFTICWTETGNP